MNKYKINKTHDVFVNNNKKNSSFIGYDTSVGCNSFVCNDESFLSIK